jgi:hypothetical protein
MKKQVLFFENSSHRGQFNWCIVSARCARLCLLTMAALRNILGPTWGKTLCVSLS